MKRVLLGEYTQLSEKLTSLVAVLNYRYMNLCVKAEEASLLSVEVEIDGERKHLEEAARAAKKNDYQFMVFPNYEEDLLQVAKGFMMYHPEFKQKILKLSVDVPNEQGNNTPHDVQYIELTMPEVDDERYDVLKQGVNAYYEETKAMMDTAVVDATPRIMSLARQETAEDAEKVSKALDKLSGEKKEQIAKLRDEKLQEVDSAYNKWLAEKAQQEIARLEEEDARGTTTGIRLSDMHEY